MSTSSADRIVQDLQRWIAAAPAGARMPSSRELAARYGASPVTVQRAMRTLVGLGLVESRPGAGSFVLGARTHRPSDFGWQTGALRSAGGRVPLLSTPLRDAATDAIGLHSGYPARELLPERLVRAALTRAARGHGALTRGPATGLPALQSWFAAELAAATPPGITPVAARDVLVVPGTQSGLSSIFRALAMTGSPVITQSPTYWGALLAAAQAGVRVVPVESDAEGPVPEDLGRTLARTGARLFYAQPTFANPSGASWSPARRDQVLSVVREHGAFLVEDDWARDFGIDEAPAPLAAFDDAGHVIHVRSLTKSVSPAVRVGAVIGRGPVRDRLLADLAAESMYVSPVLQAAATEVVLDPSWRAHLRRLRDHLRERRDLLTRSVVEHMPAARIERLPRGGLNLWVRLPDEVDANQLERDCEQDGVLIAAGTEWFPSDPSGPYVRLNYAGPDPARFPEGTAIIGRAMGRQMR